MKELDLAQTGPVLSLCKRRTISFVILNICKLAKKHNSVLSGHILPYLCVTFESIYRFATKLTLLYSI